jgi:hypothetical protein
MNVGEKLRGLPRRPALWAYIAGAIFVTIWTLLRFFTQRSIFDLVSQQVIVRQWLHGSHTTAHVGQTSYVLKMLFLYVPLQLLPGSPRLKLILLTLCINLVTFALLTVLLRKILQEFRIKITAPFYIAIVWLAMLAGSVFWISFANSRNLEVVGGVLLIYLALRYLRQPSTGRIILLLAVAAILFLADPLQLYMTALPLLVYAAILTIRGHKSWRNCIALVLVFAAGFVLSKVLFVIFGKLLLLNFSETGSIVVPHISASWLLHGLVGTLKSVLTLFAGAKDAGRLREMVNLLLALGAAGLALYATRKRLISRRLLVLFSCFLVVDVVVYIASGQAAQAGTSRYLIMIMPAAILVGAALHISAQVSKYILAIILLMIGINLVMLGHTLAVSWDTSFPLDRHLASVARYARTHPKLHVYASDDTAMPTLYYFDLPAADILPLGCLNGALVKTHYSMDTEFAAATQRTGKMAAIIFDGTRITNKPNNCTPESVTKQTGHTPALDHTDDGSVVLLYPQEYLKLSQ